MWLDRRCVWENLCFTNGERTQHEAPGPRLHKSTSDQCRCCKAGAFHQSCLAPLSVVGALNFDPLYSLLGIPNGIPIHLPHLPWIFSSCEWISGSHRLRWPGIEGGAASIAVFLRSRVKAEAWNGDSWVVSSPTRIWLCIIYTYMEEMDVMGYLMCTTNSMIHGYVSKRGPYL